MRPHKSESIMLISIIFGLSRELYIQFFMVAKEEEE